MKTKLLILLTMLLTCGMQVKGAGTVTVGTYSTKTLGGIAFGDYWHYNASQTMYTASELGNTSRCISEIGFAVKSTAGTTKCDTLRIYMADTSLSLTNFASTRLKESEMTLVYEAVNVTLGKVVDGYQTITLHRSFQHSSSKNLVVAISSTKANVVNVQYKCEERTGKCFGGSHDTDAKYASLFNGNPMGDLKCFPVTRFGYYTPTTNFVNLDNAQTNSINGFGEYYHYVGSQTLYTPDEVGMVGTIKSIGFAMKSSSKKIFSRVKIYMAETDQTILDKDHKLSIGAMTKVFEDSVAVGVVTDGYQSFNLQTPFSYSGQKNLVIAISTCTGGFSNVEYYYNSKSNRRVYVVNDYVSAYADAFYSSMKITSNVPITRFSMDVESTRNCMGHVQYKIVGSGTTPIDYLGFNPYWGYYGSQTLYLASEIKRQGELSGIGFEISSIDDSSVSSEIEIYLAETDQSTLTVENPLTRSQMTLVAKVKKNLGSKTGYEMVMFDRPFFYSGLKNLVVAVSSKNPDGFPCVEYKCTQLKNRAIYCKDDNDVSYGSPFSSYLGISNYVPNTQFYFVNHSDVTASSDGCYASCSACCRSFESYQSPTQLVSGSAIYGITNVGQLKGFAQRVAWGTATGGYYYYLQNDIDISGYDWIPIGTVNPLSCSLNGYNYSNKEIHTIKGLGSSDYLIENLKSRINFIYLPTGNLVKNGADGGKVVACLVMNGKLYNSQGAAVRDSSFYKASSWTADGGRSDLQFSSGEVTYGLNNAGSSTVAKYHQTLNSDSYPTTSGSALVYRATKCEKYYYSNSSISNISHKWVNTVCSECNKQPTTISENMTLVDSNPYLRIKDATISSSGKVTYSRNFNSMSNWYPLYLPFAVQYNSTLAQNVEIAELSAYGVKDDTNNDGNINSQDQRKLTMSLLKVGDTTEPNKPYLVRAKKTGTISFPSYGATLAKNDENSLALSTMKETFVATGCYSSKTVTPAKTNGKMLNSNGTRFYSVSSSASSSPFRWVGEISNNNGTEWDQSLLPIVFTDCAYPEFAIVDNETSSYKRATEVTVNNFSYSRIFADRQIGNWQSLYLPFDLTVTSDMLEDVEIARLDDVTTKAGVDYFVVTKLESGQTLEANTLAVIRIKDSALDEDHYWNLSFDQVTLKPAANTKKVFETDQAKYTFTGVYEPYSNDVSTWYAIAKSDGLLHEAGLGAKLPAYRFYMTIDDGTTSAAEIRIGFLENDPFATGIREVVEEDENQTGVYTLDGRRVQSESIQPGIYVKNGKKIWVK